MPIIEGVIQESAEWVKMRVGCVTASRIKDVVAKLKRKEGEAAARLNYRRELRAERNTGLAANHYVNGYMEWGTEHQDAACAAYEIHTGQMVDQGGFWMHDTIPWFGASPDYLVGDDGLVEIKCLTTENHEDILDSQQVPEEFLWQIMGELSCTGRQWCDFVSYDPREPQPLQLFVKRVPRDEKLISAVEVEVKQFLMEVDLMVKKLSRKEVAQNP